MTIRLAAPALDEAAALLHAGKLVAFPTETVYGLGGDATSDESVAAIFAAKGRPRFNPLIVHLSRADQAERFAQIDSRAAQLMQRFWPGPLSLVLRRAPRCPISLLASAGLDTLALRVPAHPLALELIRLADRPIAAPSANRSGRVSPTTADHVMAELDGHIAAVLDGGPCRVGVESTVVDLSGRTPLLLRPGGIATEDLETLLGPLVAPNPEDAPRAPGMLTSHYAPSLPLRLNATNVGASEALLAFGPDAPAGARETLWLSQDGNVEEAAAKLFGMLRALDRAEYTAIAVMPIPERGLGRAINDRLRRAAAR
ncbi:MAG TPA: L-threonylcarbamoyladenylate synthase [Stellaceae bacterium]|nr:L-threonylcarbamoyladenylate synthase [Stellaceae bacterium]